ncbi:MAG: hypothetical protein ACLRFE_01745 [Clostridia bacterium]
MMVDKLDKGELIALNNIKNRILKLYDYPELVVPNINDICACACYGNRFSDMKRPVHLLIYILNKMDDKELFGFADDLYYWKSKMAYRDRKPSLISWLQDDVVDNINCSRRLKKYLKFRGGYTYKLLDDPLEQTDDSLEEHKVDKNEFYGLLVRKFKMSLLPNQAHHEIYKKAKTAYLHSHFLFTPNDIKKYGLQDIEQILAQCGLIPTAEQIAENRKYNDEVKEIYNNIVGNENTLIK